MWDQAFLLRGRRDRMVVEFTITYALNAESLSVLSEKMRSYKCFPYASKMPNLTSNRASSVIIKNAMIFLTQKQGMWEGIQPVHRSGTRRARKFTWTFEFCCTRNIKHLWKFTSGFIGPQILNFERSLSVIHWSRSILVHLAKFLLEALHSKSYT
jgi:hypothetical protein